MKMYDQKHIWMWLYTMAGLHWPNSLDYTDLNQCGARRDAELLQTMALHSIENKLHLILSS